MQTFSDAIVDRARPHAPRVQRARFGRRTRGKESTRVGARSARSGRRRRGGEPQAGSRPKRQLGKDKPARRGGPKVHRRAPASSRLTRKTMKAPVVRWRSHSPTADVKPGGLVFHAGGDTARSDRERAGKEGKRPAEGRREGGWGRVPDERGGRGGRGTGATKGPSWPGSGGDCRRRCHGRRGRAAGLAGRRASRPRRRPGRTGAARRGPERRTEGNGRGGPSQVGSRWRRSSGGGG